MRVQYSPFGPVKKGFALPDFLLVFFIMAVLVYMYIKTANLPGYSWNWKLLGEFILIKNSHNQFEPGLLLKGLITTLRIGIWTIIFSLITGISFGLFQTIAPRPIFHISQIAINLIRNIPPLVLLFCIYFFAGNIFPTHIVEDFIRNLPDFWSRAFYITVAPQGQLDRMFAAVLALGIYQASYIAEITRGGIASINPGQWDASLALGFSKLQCLWLIILPQTGRLVIPPLTGQAITAFKDSALASLISLPDLTFQSLEIMAVSRLTFEIWISCAFLYLIIGIICAIIGHILEKKYSLHPF